MGKEILVPPEQTVLLPQITFYFTSDQSPKSVSSVFLSISEVKIERIARDSFSIFFASDV